MNSLREIRETEFQVKVARIARELQFMSDNPSKVALAILQAGVKGRRRDTHSCALAEYIKRQYSLQDVGVTEYHIFLYDGCFFAHLKMTEAANRFMEHFDAGCYPDIDIDAQQPCDGPSDN